MRRAPTGQYFTSTDVRIGEREVGGAGLHHLGAATGHSEGRSPVTQLSVGNLSGVAFQPHRVETVKRSQFRTRYGDDTTCPLGGAPGLQGLGFAAEAARVMVHVLVS